MWDHQDLSSCVAVVTGASDGIGYETAKALASMGTRTILACRNEAKTRQVSRIVTLHVCPSIDIQFNIHTCLCSNYVKRVQAMECMREELGRAEGELKLEFMHLDLASFSSTKQFVANFKQRNCPLHILINNAAIAFVPLGEAHNLPLFHRYCCTLA